MLWIALLLMLQTPAKMSIPNVCMRRPHSAHFHNDVLTNDSKFCDEKRHAETKWQNMQKAQKKQKKKECVTIAKASKRWFKYTQRERETHTHHLTKWHLAIDLRIENKQTSENVPQKSTNNTNSNNDCGDDNDIHHHHHHDDDGRWQWQQNETQHHTLKVTRSTVGQ